ncbi:TetR/AcrR family transcriptional regulator [Paludibacterium paludis]|uniref:TetR family transcriptional regulator n=1 Tax=Paludibacterium paludis TaxID=1225769 RepID=A0A918P5C6_9NEIS|nr:TetR/AcrR family transcriptional regulator [Paludibacterium paludis]GGY25386.1 TetR family transcriptional regulator [Paludibacterium paludis]
MTTTPLVAARGRPAVPEEELKRQVLRAAAHLLTTRGYAAATIEAVAREAGVAKKTVYRFVSNREELVGAIVGSWTDEFAGGFAAPDEAGLPAAERLALRLEAVARNVLCAEAVGMYRLLIGEFPGREAALADYARYGIERGRRFLAEWLAAEEETDPVMMADLLLSMCIAEPLRQMALGLCGPWPEGGGAARIRAAVSLWDAAR